MYYRLQVVLYVSASSLGAQSSAEMFWAVSARQDKRSHMEDTFTAKVLHLPSANKEAFYFGLFDGHGRNEASLKAAETAADHFYSAYNRLTISSDDPTHIQRSFTESYHLIDQSIGECTKTAGTTALSAFIYEGHLYVAWAGDSRALLIKKDGAIKIQSRDHKLLRSSEKQRLDAIGQIVTVPWRGVPRIGRLAVSRALGDADEKEYLAPGSLICDPEMIVEVGDTVILASDGLWDVLSNEEVAEMLHAEKHSFIAESPEQLLHDAIMNQEDTYEETNDLSGKSVHLVRYLRNKAYALGSQDNISVVIITIDQLIVS